MQIHILQRRQAVPIMSSLVAGTPEYNRSENASALVQKVQQLRDIQASRGNVKEKLKKNKQQALGNVSLVFKSQNVGPRALHLVAEFLIETKMPISEAHVQKAKKIETRVDEVHQVRHLFQQWSIEQDPIAIIQHYLSVVVENRLAVINSPSGKESKEKIIKNLSIPDLKKLCRMRYLKVSGKKNVLVERLMTEKW